MHQKLCEYLSADNNDQWVSSLNHHTGREVSKIDSLNTTFCFWLVIFVFHIRVSALAGG